VETVLPAAGVTLHGWRCSTPAPRRASIVYLHGIADTRTSSRPVIERFLHKGFDVAAFDSRAHGRSSGRICTYGVYEKQDLRRILDTLPACPVILIGHSLGAAVALQAAADDPRISAVVAAETFSGLRTVATERAPFFFSESTLARAFDLAERQAGFRIDDASPLAAAPRIRVPVLLLHGAADRDTPPDHSRRVFRALGGPKQLLLLPGVRHAGSLNSATWPLIESWILQALPSACACAPRP
jgi:alpha-beta hydrolase superfamily lysophospholipase